MEKTTETAVLEAFAEMDVRVKPLQGYMGDMLQMRIDRRVAMKEVLKRLDEQAPTIWDKPDEAVQNVRSLMEGKTMPARQLELLADLPEHFGPLRKRGVFGKYKAARAAAKEPLRLYCFMLFDEAAAVGLLLEQLPEVVGEFDERRRQLERVLTNAHGQTAVEAALRAAEERKEARGKRAFQFDNVVHTDRGW